jgi:hypothetical protein
MRGRLVAAACGLVLAVALGVPAAAQAAVSRPGPADARTTPAAPDASVPCATFDDLGNNHYAGWADSSHTYIYFGVDLSHAIPFCNVNRGNGRFWIEEEINGQLSGNCISAGTGGIEWFSCDDSWSDWTGTKVGTYHSQSIWMLNDPYTSNCLYDDLQDPAIENPCITSDAFEHFIWDALP